MSRAPTPFSVMQKVSSCPSILPTSSSIFNQCEMKCFFNASMNFNVLNCKLGSGKQFNDKNNDNDQLTNGINVDTEH